MGQHLCSDPGDILRRLASYCLLLLLFAIAPFPVQAQTAEDRAGELKAWREQCSDPDADLRLAYLEAALETADVSIIRICVRQSLESDNADIRNLGLRAAIASIDQLAFEVEIPPALDKALKAADDDDDKLDEIYGWYVYRDWLLLKTGLVITVDDAELATGKSVWYPMVNRTEPSESYSGKATIIGDKVTWVGSASLNRNDCRLSLSLAAGPVLEGELQCSDITPFHVTAKLL